MKDDGMDMDKNSVGYRVKVLREKRISRTTRLEQLQLPTLSRVSVRRCPTSRKQN